jgi:MFS family permease
LIAILFLAVGIIWAGWWADKSSPRTVLMTGCILTVLASFALAPLMGSGSLWMIGAFLALAQLLMGLVYGPLGAWLPGLFPARVRYTGASIAFNVGGILGGGLTPFIATQLVQMGGLQYVGFYLGAATGLSFLALLLLKPRPAQT